MKNQVLIIGNFGHSTNKINGQTIKTRNLHELLLEKLTENVTIFDTNLFETKKSSIFTLIGKLFTANKIIYMPAHSSLKFIFPFIYLICTIKRTEIIYLVIGGWLPEFIKSKPFHKWALKKISVIFCETEQMKYKLDQWYDFKNVKLLPNFRIHSYKPIIKNKNVALNVVFMSRIIIDKGLDVIFRFIENNLKSEKPIQVKIDFYGPLPNPNYEYFFENLKKHSNLAYKGLIKPEDVYAVLNEYDIMVLPTRYEGEGFPGAILDSYIAGIPVLVSNWKDIASFVESGKSGFVFELNEEDNFRMYLNELYNNKELLLQMKHQAFEKSKEYSSEVCWEIIKPYLNN